MVRGIAIVIVSIGTIRKGFLRELEESEIGRRAEIIQATALRLAKITFFRPGVTYCRLVSNERASANAGLKTSREIIKQYSWQSLRPFSSIKKSLSINPRWNGKIVDWIKFFIFPL